MNPTETPQKPHKSPEKSLTTPERPFSSSKPGKMMKLPTGKDLDVRQILRSKTLKASDSGDANPDAIKEVDRLMHGVMLFQKAGKEAKMGKKNQNYSNNPYKIGKLEDDEFQRIKIENDAASVSGTEEMNSACRNISTVLKLRYKYLFHPHQDCKPFPSPLIFSSIPRLRPGEDHRLQQNRACDRLQPGLPIGPGRRSA